MRALPSPRVVFALALAVFATGFALGAAAGPSAPSSYASGAASNDPIVVVLPAPAAPAAPAAVAPATAAPPATAPVQAPVATTPAPEPPAETTEPTETTPTETTPDEDETPAKDPTPKLPAVKHVWLIALTGHGLQDGFGPDSHSVLLRETMPRKGVLLLDHHAVAPERLDAALPLVTAKLTGAGLTWKAYVEDLVPDAGGPCGFAASPRQPFREPEDCSNVVGTVQLDSDLSDEERTPSLSYIVPGACHDGSDTPCAPGAIPGTAGADAWLRTTLRAIRSTPTYKRDGLIVITFDQGPPDGKVGALLLSHFLTPGATVDTATDHVSLLRTIVVLITGRSPVGNDAVTTAPPTPFEDAAANLWRSP